MIQELFDKNIFIYVIIGLCGAGVLIKGVVAFVYGSLIRASDHMGSSQNKLMKLIRLKFETCYKLKIGVNNVDTFVDKYVYKHRFCGVLLYTWENLSGQFMILCLLTGSVASVLGLAYECERREILSTLFVGIFTSALLISLDYLFNLYIKRRVLRTNIKEYLENFLKARLENEDFNAEVIERYHKEYFDLINNKKGKIVKRKMKTEVLKGCQDMKEESAATQVDSVLEENKEIISRDARKANSRRAEISKAETRKGEKEEASKEEEVEILEIIDLGNNPKGTKNIRKMKKEVSTLEINKREEKIIEDILKEYLI